MEVKEFKKLSILFIMAMLSGCLWSPLDNKLVVNDLRQNSLTIRVLFPVPNQSLFLGCIDSIGNVSYASWQLSNSNGSPPQALPQGQNSKRTTGSAPFLTSGTQPLYEAVWTNISLANHCINAAPSPCPPGMQCMTDFSPPNNVGAHAWAKLVVLADGFPNPYKSGLNWAPVPTYDEQGWNCLFDNSRHTDNPSQPDWVARGLKCATKSEYIRVYSMLNNNGL